jgi:hypothetical protein
MNKKKLLGDLQEEFRGTQVEKVLLAYADVTPMWEIAVVPNACEKVKEYTYE